MVIRCIINSITCTGHVISIKVTSPDNENEIAEKIKEIKTKGTTHKFILDHSTDIEKTPPLHIDALVISINDRKHLHMVLHIDRESGAKLLNPLFHSIDKPAILKFNTAKELELFRLLFSMEKTTKRPIAGILLEMSSFEGKRGIVQGKKSVYDLSDDAKDVVIDKLKKLLSQNGDQQQKDKAAVAILNT